ncbi:MAG: ribosome biogenesis GTPase YlqF [Clostridiales bacterium]|jgi:ribosome biogenesis GTPase A|nr:ribosome biogenesis GTPase YlqF [Clostridiales bacterium]
MHIQWYPGHMAKARRMLRENLKLIDVVVELVDARAPLSTGNPDFDALFQGKGRVMLLNKADLADEAVTGRWVAAFQERGMAALSFVSTGGDKRAVAALIERAAAEKVERLRKKGINKTVRVMVVGIPNVGKSTFINRIAGASRVRVADWPGVTRGKQWVKITPLLELMDTPGLLWPKLDNAVYAKRLAFLGSIKDTILDVERLACALLEELRAVCPEALEKRYGGVNEDAPGGVLLERLCKSRGFLLPGGEWDTQRGARIVLDEFRAGKIARVTLDDPGEMQGRKTYEKDDGV